MTPCCEVFIADPRRIQNSARLRPMQYGPKFSAVAGQEPTTTAPLPYVLVRVSSLVSVRSAQRLHPRTTQELDQGKNHVYPSVTVSSSSTTFVRASIKSSFVSATGSGTSAISFFINCRRRRRGGRWSKRAATVDSGGSGRGKA